MSEVLRSPDAASVQSQPKVSPPSAGSLPMRRAKPEGGNSEGALGPEKLAELKKEVSEAKKDSKLQRKASKVTIDKGFVPEKPKVTPDEPSQAFLKRRAESTAARKYLDSLATGANPGAVSSQKKPAANTNKTRKAKAKAKARSKASASKKVKSTINKARCFGSIGFFQRLFRDTRILDIMSTFFKTLIEWCMIVS